MKRLEGRQSISLWDGILVMCVSRQHKAYHMLATSLHKGLYWHVVDMTRG